MKAATVGKIVFVAAVIIVATWWFVSQHGESHAGTATPVATSTTSISPATTGTSEAAPVTSDPYCVRDTAQLKSKMQQFVTGWYLLTPEDTTQTRQARMQSYFDQDYDIVRSLTVNTTSRADQARIAQRITLRGRSVQEVNVYCIPSDPDSAQVTTSVETWQEKNKLVVKGSTYATTLTALWHKTGSTWRITAVDEAGGG